MFSIDVHSHIIPSQFINLIRSEGSRYKAELIENQSGKKIVFGGKSIHPCTEDFYSLEYRLEYMDKKDINMQMLSVSPRLFYYNYPIDLAYEIASLCNNEIYKIIKKYKDNFIGIGTVPLQDIDLSIKILKTFKFKAVEIGTRVNNKCISDSYFFPFFAEAAKNNIVIFLHPVPVIEVCESMHNYHLSNIIGNPFNTTLAAANLVFSGLFNELPNLQFVLAHGGGFIPYQIGRFDHGYCVRQESKVNLIEKPSNLFKNNFYYDTVIYNKLALEYLVKVFGDKRVLLGSDYPYDMADQDPVQKIRQLDVSTEQKENILSVNTLKLMGIC